MSKVGDVAASIPSTVASVVKGAVESTPEASNLEQMMYPGYAPVAKFAENNLVTPGWKLAKSFMSGPINAAFMAKRAKDRTGEALAKVGGAFAAEGITNPEYGGAFSEAHKEFVSQWQKLKADAKADDFLKRTEDEWLQRETASALGGDAVRLGAYRDPESHQWEMDMDSPELRAAINNLEAEHGATKGAFLQGFAQELGSLPLYLGAGKAALGEKATVGLAQAAARALEIGPKSTTLAGTALKAVAAVLCNPLGKAAVSGAVEGGAFGQLAALKDNGDLAENTLLGAATGAVMGAGMHGLERGVSYAAPEAWKAAFPLGPAEHKALRDEVFEMLLKPETSALMKDIQAMGGSEKFYQAHAMSDAIQEAGHVSISGEVGKNDREVPWLHLQSEKLKNPLVFGLTRSNEGRIIGRAIEVRLDLDTGRPAMYYHDTELPTDDAAQRWVSGYGVRASKLSHSGEFNLTPHGPAERSGRLPGSDIEDVQGVIQSAIQRDIAARMNEAPKPSLTGFNKPDESEDIGDIAKRVMREIQEAGGNDEAPQVLGVAQNGTVEARPANVTRKQRSPVVEPKFGDQVTIHGADGSQRGGIVQEVRPDGKFLVRRTKGKKARASFGHDDVVVDREQLAPGFTPKAAAGVSKALRASIDPEAADALRALSKNAREQSLDWRAARKEAELDAREFFGVLHPQDLSNYLGVTPGEAVEAIASWEAEGTKVVDGVAITKGKTNPVPDQGMYVYFGDPTSPTGTQKAIYRGPDPKVPGNHLLQFPDPEGGLVHDASLSPPANVAKKTETVSVPREQFNDARPVHLANELLAKAPATWGLNQPIPPNVVLVHDKGSLNEVVTLGRNLDKQVKLLSKDGAKKLVEAVRDMWNSPMMKGPSSLQGARFVLHSAKEVEPKLRQVALDAIMKAGKVEAYEPQALALKPVLKARASLLPGEKVSPQSVALEVWVKKNPQTALEAQKVVGNLLDSVKVNQERFAKNQGPLGPDVTKLEFERALGNEDEYMLQEYNIFKAREDWTKYIQKQRPDIWNGAIEYLSGEKLKRGEIFTSSEVVSTLQDVLHDAPKTSTLSDLVGSMRDKGLIDANAAKAMLARKEIPTPIKALLGEETSGVVALANSYARSEIAASRLEALSALAESPYWSRGPREDLPVPVPMRAEFGKAAGGFVGAEWGDLFNPAQEKTAHNWFQRVLVGTPGRMWKRNVTVYGGPGVWLSNMLRNMKGMVLGGMDPWRMEENASAFRDAARLLSEWHKDPTNFGKGALVNEAMKMAALQPGMAATELNTKQRRMNALVLEQFQKPVSLEANFLKAKDLVASGNEAVTGAYDSIDQLSKLATYLVRRRTNIANGMSVNDAAVEAGLRIQQSFPQYAIQSKFLKALQENGISTVAPFITSKLQDMRVSGTSIARLASGDRSLQARVLKLGLLGAGLYGGVKASRYANGISDDMVENEWNRMPMSVRSMRKAPLSLGYDEKGRMLFADTTAYDDFFMSLKGSPLDSVPASFARSTLADIFGEHTLAGRAINTGFAAMGNEAARAQLQSRAPIPRPGQEDSSQLLQLLAKEAALIPQAPFRLQSALELGGVGRSPFDTREVFTPTETLGKAAGLALEVAGPGQDIRRMHELQGANKEFKGALRNAGKDAKGNAADALRRAQGSAKRYSDVVHEDTKGQ